MLSESQVAALLELARQARRSAYSPYSGYSVGAAVLDSAGRLSAGCNVENASYGLTICAERSAVFAAVGAGLRPGELRGVALVGGAAAGAEGDARWPAQPTPCGACLQVLAEFAAPDCSVICAGDDPDAPAVVLKLAELLPRAFRGQPV